MTELVKLCGSAMVLGHAATAGAHPGHREIASLYHYLASPDHSVVLVLLCMGAAGLLTRCGCRWVAATRRRSS